MKREDSRNTAEGYCIQIISIEGVAAQDLANESFRIDNIGRGGFRFIAGIDLEVDTRLKVILNFPDETAQEVSGRICYCDTDITDKDTAYGFSVIDGFYSLTSRDIVRKKIVANNTKQVF